MHHVRHQALGRRGLAFVIGNLVASIGGLIELFSVLAIILTRPLTIFLNLILIGFVGMIIGNAMVIVAYTWSPKKELKFRFLNFTFVLLMLSVLAIYMFQFVDITQVLVTSDGGSTLIFFTPTTVYLTMLSLMMLNAISFYGLILRKRIKLHATDAITSIFTDFFQVGEIIIIITLLTFLVSTLLLDLANNVVIALFSLMGATIFNSSYLIGALWKPQQIFPEYKELKIALKKGRISYIMYYFGMMGPEPILARLLKVSLNEKELRRFLIDFGIKHMTATGFGIEYEGGMISGRLTKPIIQDFLFLSGWGRGTREHLDHRFERHPYLGFCLLVDHEYQWVLEQKEYWEYFRLNFLENVIIDDISFELVERNLNHLFLMIILQVPPKADNHK